MGGMNEAIETKSMAGDEFQRRDELSERLRWLLNLRWMALSSVCVAVLCARLLHYLESAWPLALVTAAMAILNLGFLSLHARVPVRSLRALSAEALLQITIDVFGLGLLMFFSGALSNPFIFYFIFHVVIAGILTGLALQYFTRSVGLGLLDRAIGIMFGFVRGLVLLGLASTW